MDTKKTALEMHYEWKGKISMQPTIRVQNQEDLAVAYTPGVAQACLAIKDEPKESFNLTRRWNTVAVVTDGTAVLGLGDIGPEAGMPVMEGKCLLFKEFGDIDAIPLCIRSKDTDEIVKTISLLLGSFGGINLEDISAPRCFEIEKRLREISDIPIFHDDQHGTAIVVAAALINALYLAKKEFNDIKVVISGAGAAGTAIGDLIAFFGVKNIIYTNRRGALVSGMEGLNPAQAALADRSNPNKESGSLADVVKGADVFIGVSAAGLLTADMVKTMANDPIIFALANPTPEIMPDVAKSAGARIIGTGRSDFPNQINNVLVFPGIFRGALDCRARDITPEMKVAAARALAAMIPKDELHEDYIIPDVFDKRVTASIAKAVMECAREQGIAGC